MENISSPVSPTKKTTRTPAQKKSHAVHVAVLVIIGVIALAVIIAWIFVARHNRRYSTFVAEKQAAQQAAFVEYLKGNTAPAPTEEQTEEFMKVLSGSKATSQDGEVFYESLKRNQAARDASYKEEFKNK